MTDINDENSEASQFTSTQDDRNRVGEPERSEGMGMPARQPDVEQASVTHYAYDSQTYEILCRPGQRLSLRKAQRLQELNLYAHVVTFAE